LKLRTILFYSRALFGLNGGEPDFLIVGAQKSGTTSLFRYVVQSPAFTRPAGKELHYFDRQYDQPFSFYRRQFPKRRKGRFTGEASPSYLFFEFVPERVAEHLPDIRIIATLRNPIDRALSHFNHNKRRGKFLQVDGRAITTFEEHVAHNLEMDMASETSLDELKNFYIVERGFYQAQIENWLKFFPIEQFHFIDLDRLTGDPQGEVDRLMHFLHQPPFRLVSTDRFNSGGNYSRDIAPATHVRLADLYRRENAGLSALVGFPTEQWFEPGS